MRLTIKTFGIASDIMSGKNVAVEITGNTVGDLRKELSIKYPSLDKLNSLFIAVNRAYADNETILLATDEIALIPPVSGG
jgi:molybdopterin synthase sulfur carrier subunit